MAHVMTAAEVEAWGQHYDRLPPAIKFPGLDKGTQVVESGMKSWAWLCEGREPQPGEVVLDVGFGSAKLVAPVACSGLGLTYHGVDCRLLSVAWAREQFRHRLVGDRLNFHYVDARTPMYNPHGTVPPEEFTIPLPSRCVHSVVAYSLFTHLETMPVAARYLEEIHRVMVPGGISLITWFRSPPNDVEIDAKRTVYKEEEIRSLYWDRFEVVSEAGGATTAVHDQWRILATKLPGPWTP